LAYEDDEGDVVEMVDDADVEAAVLLAIRRGMGRVVLIVRGDAQLPPLKNGAALAKNVPEIQEMRAYLGKEKDIDEMEEELEMESMMGGLVVGSGIAFVIAFFIGRAFNH
jgi:hypothetical protein